MFMTVSATGVVAILALAGALAVPALVADEESSPAGAETPLVTSGWAFFEGTFAETDWCDVEASVTESSAACVTRVSPTESDFDVEGLQHSFGHGYSGETVIASDPRISGSWDVRENTYMDRSRARPSGTRP